MIEEGFTWPVRVYYEDTDAAGIVYHARYLHFMERGRTEWLRALGFEQDRLWHEARVAFVVHRTDVRYLRVARFNEALVVTSRIAKLGGASIVFDQAVERGNGEVVCAGVNTVACVDAASFRPRRVPEFMMGVFRGGN